VPKAKRKPTDPATQYAREVVAGRIVAGKLVRQACERHLRDLRDGHRAGLRFDAEAAQVAIDFFGLLRHSKGKWGGEVFRLEPWQKFIVGCLFGWKRGDGTRRFRVAHIEVARKNGKTTLAAGIGLLLFVLDGEPGSEVYTVATKRDQARITHEESKRMVQKSPSLKKSIQVYRDNLNIAETNSKYEPLGADSDTLDGLNVHGAIADELHAWKDRKLWDVIETATGARSQPLILATTTAGYDRHTIWWERRELCIKVLDQAIEDDELFALIYTLDEDDDWTNEAAWPKANPSLGVTVQIEDLRTQCEQAKVTPGKQNPFKRLRLNMPTEQADRWLSLAVWDACKSALPRDKYLAKLAGRECFGALDLSSKVDLTAFGLLFPMDNEELWALLFFFMPRETAQQRAEEDRISYPLWIEQGWIEATEGRAVDYDAVRQRIVELREAYRIREIAVDGWNATQLSNQLMGDGFDVIEFRQGYRSISDPSKELEKLLLTGKFIHDGNPVLRWNASNVAAVQDPAGNIKPDKGKSTGRIDGIVTTIMGIGRFLAQPTMASVYDDRGILVIADEEQEPAPKETVTADATESVWDGHWPDDDE
jgi:phage terminase large subunit-like protein